MSLSWRDVSHSQKVYPADFFESKEIAKRIS